LILALLLLGGSGLGLLTAAARDYLDDRVRNRQRLSADSGLRVLGEVPRWSASGPSSSTLLPYLAGQISGQQLRRAAESYRLLMTSLGVTTAQARPSSIMVASARGGEGKTTTAANLAIVLAAAGRRVILVDANLYRPALTRLFGVGNRTGLSTLLLNPQEPLDPVLKYTAQSGLRLLTSGPAPADPSALLSSDRLDARLVELVAASDVVVIDTPPLLAQPDAALLGARVDAVLLVAEPTSRSSEVRRAVEILAEAGATLVGSTLNRARVGGLRYTAETYEAGPSGPGGSASQSASAVDVSRPQEQA
jgi:succinoglycan biosynthesis transport protein ExoP